MALRTSKTTGEKPAKPTAVAKTENGKPVAKAKPAVKAKPLTVVKAGKPAKMQARSAKPEAAAARKEAFRLKDLVAEVAEATGGKKPDVKRTVEATLAALAGALGRGTDLAVPPLGRARVVKAAGKDGAAVLTLKLRLGGADTSGAKLGLADDGEDS